MLDMQLKIYGEQAKKLHAGQTFTVTMDSVEGRVVAILESTDNDK